MEHRPRAARDAGFTIVETMVAVLILLVGVLGTLKLISAANAVGQTSRSREAATNLARDVVEAARTIDYDTLLTPTATPALQAAGGLADADATASGWQVSRRGVTFTVIAASCIYDDPKDGNFSGNAGTGYCPGATAGTADRNGDDYRKLDVTVVWGTRNVKLTANVVNPAGGFGPRVTAVPPTTVSTPAVNGAGILLALAGNNTIAMTVNTTSATGFNWDAGDAKNGGQLTNPAGGTSWSFTWPLAVPEPAASYTCSTQHDWVPDAPAYQMTFQPTDSSGTPGDLRTQVISIDRSVPYELCNFAGGHNVQHGGVVDLQWRASFEGDVTSYSVWREDPAGDVLVCDAVTAAECTDTNPPPSSDPISYHVKPRQANSTPGSLGSAFGPETDLTVPADSPANAAPDEPTGVTIAPGSKPEIAWGIPNDSDGTVAFYRIYRAPAGSTSADLDERYGRTINGTTVDFIDTDTGAVSYEYFVSAVDDDFNESAAVQAVPVP